MVTVEEIRKALDEALREADMDQATDEDRHLWCGPVTEEDGSWERDCVAHGEGQHCCLDPDHGAYGKLLDYLAERVASKLMYRGGAVTNVVATIGKEELRLRETLGRIERAATAEGRDIHSSDYSSCLGLTLGAELSRIAAAEQEKRGERICDECRGAGCDRCVHTGVLDFYGSPHTGGPIMIPRDDVKPHVYEPDWSKYPQLQNCFDEFGKGLATEVDSLIFEARADALSNGILDAFRKNVSYTPDPEPTGDGLRKYEDVLQHWPANNLEIRIELSTNAHKVWVIDSHPKSRKELHEKLKSVHGLRGETEYVLVFYDVTANNAVRAVGSVVMQSTL